MAQKRLRIVNPDGSAHPTLFWVPEKARANEDKAGANEERIPTSLSGSFRKDRSGLKLAYDRLLEVGCKILSPSSVDFVAEREGFAFARGETKQRPQTIEGNHLKAIQQSAFVWLHAPEGYIGPSALVELGAAYDAGVPVFSDQTPDDVAFRDLVRVVSHPHDAVAALGDPATFDPGHPLRALQSYYSRAAKARGWSDESPRDSVLLLTEELGELARAVRKISGLKRDRAWAASVAEELADMQLYLVHIANATRIDLAEAVTAKEVENARRAAAREEASA